MVAVNIQGGLGNQLFEYAFAYATAKRLRTLLLLDNSCSFVVPKYFNVTSRCVLINKIPYIRRLYREKVARLKLSAYKDWSDCWRDISTEEMVENNCYYNGFFQSKAFFSNNERKIRRLYTIRKKYKAAFEKKYGSLYADNKVIAMHVRRTDYLTHGRGKNLGADDLSLPVEYYFNALQRIERNEQYKIVVVGDDIEWMKLQFSDIPNVIVAHNEMIVDFQLLMNADVIVCSNGTFAWWAAYLNSKRDKQVFVPKYFLGYHVKREFPVGIYKDTQFTEVEW